MSGQTLLKDVDDLTPASSSSPHNWAAATDSLFIFQGINTLSTNTLFASNGTESGTVGLGNYQVDTDIIHFGNRAYFGGCNPSLGAGSCASLYVSDGTVAGTTLFFDPEPTSVSLGISDIVAGDSLFYFAAHTLTGGYELYRSNGTVAGTYQVADIEAGTGNGYNGELAVIDDVAYFAGFTTQDGLEPWRSDGTQAGTYMIANLNAANADAFPAGFTASGGFVYFSALGTDTGVEVHRTNGQQGNFEVINDKLSTASSNPRDFVDSDGTLYYVAEGEGAAGYELFVYNHTGDPLHIDFLNADIFPRALMPFGNGEVVFHAKKEGGRELWRSDGTLGGTQRVIDLFPGPKDGVFETGLPGESFYVLGDSLIYFAGADSIHASGETVFELFVSDGTAAGTQLVSDQYPGTQGSNPGNFFKFGDRLYFAATDPTVGREPYYLGLGSASSIAQEAFSVNKLPYPNHCQKEWNLNVELSLVKAGHVYIQVLDLQGRSGAGNS